MTLTQLQKLLEEVADEVRTGNRYMCRHMADGIELSAVLIEALASGMPASEVSEATKLYLSSVRDMEWGNPDFPIDVDVLWLAEYEPGNAPHEKG